MPSSRRRPVTISSRVTAVEKSIVQAAAASCGIPVSEFMHVTVLPEAKRVLGRALTDFSDVARRAVGVG